MVSINPGQFSDDIDVLNTSVEGVISAFIDSERQRAHDFPNDESQQEVVIVVRLVPAGLVPILDCIAHDFGVSRAVITRCLSHRVSAWYDSILPAQLVDVYYGAQSNALSKGLADVLDRFGAMTYQSIVPGVGRASFRSIAWVQSKLARLSGPLGVSLSRLFTIGVCESVVSSESGKYGGTLDILQREVEHFSAHAGQRFIEIQAVHQLVAYRVSREGRK